jgi:hypothetical protein
MTCRRRSDVVVYSGGFPSSAVLSLLRTLLAAAGTPLCQWGDIDPGGVRIGRHLETTLGVRVMPHLMRPNLARDFSTARGLAAVPLLTEESAFFGLAEYLRGTRRAVA